MMRALAVAAMLACAGCASAPPPVQPLPEEEQWAMLSEPDIPAPAPAAPPAAAVQAPARCAQEMPPKPLWPLDDPALRGKDLYAKASAALVEIELRRAYEAKLEAALRACAQTAVR
jgi:hypothetical protein